MAEFHSRRPTTANADISKSTMDRGQFDLDTETLRIQAKIVNEAAKLIQKEQKNIQRKQKKSKSKELPTCIENYNNSVMDIQEAAGIVQDIVNKDDVGNAWSTKNARKPKSVSSWNEPQIRKRKGLEEPCLQCLNKDRQIQDLEAALKRSKCENEDILNQLIQSNEEKEELRKQCEEEAARAKDDALSRLSSQVSAKLRDNNPNIADLSDKNRPTKIAEKFSELFDNQWTNAIDALKEEMDERRSIATLLDTLMKIYEECRRMSSENFPERVQKSIELPAEAKQIGRTENKLALSDGLKSQIKEFLISRATFVVKDIEKVIKPNLPLANYQGEEIQEYITVCVEICWLCAVQDPPLVLKAQLSREFDTNMFKEYTRRGQYLEYVVWPAMFLHEGGALLAKGVAQGCNHAYNIYR